MKFERISEFGLIAIIGMLCVCYKSSLNKFISSNCIRFKCCGIEIDRQPLSNEQAMELAEHQETAGNSNNVWKNPSEKLKKEV